jgi:hypothetical protein
MDAAPAFLETESRDVQLERDWFAGTDGPERSRRH